MMTDALNQLSTAQAVTTTALSTNSIDLGPQPANAGDPLVALITVDATATAAGAATVTFQVVSSASANLSTPTVLAQTDAIGKAELAAGRRPIGLEFNFRNLTAGHRYLGLQYLVGTGPLTAGAFSCVLTDTTNASGLYGAAGSFKVY
ncbi:Bbp16 family capsid cement protein [Propionivibrio sp.]|uniref:Bbp16 family capsid cement protein n=1 Tax=Propionivibrio sp. TaxID=2212460 RepID=UPI00260AB358|nr:hypothetical protein [Propionivibrio sp.]